MSAVVTSASATARSAGRPFTRHACVAFAHDRESLLGWSEHDERLGLALGAPRLVDQERDPGLTSSSSPARVTAETVSPSNGSVVTSALLPTTTRGRSRRSGRYRRSSSSSTRACSSGPRPSIGRQIAQHHQHARPLDVTQELMAQPATLGRALDQSGHVGDHELTIVAHRTTPRCGSSVVNG